MAESWLTKLRGALYKGCDQAQDLAGEDEMEFRSTAQMVKDHTMSIRLWKSVGDYLSEQGACSGAVDQDSLCRDPGCKYCAMARAVGCENEE